MTRRSRWLWLGLIAILLLPLGGWLASQHALAWAFALLTYQLPGKLSVDSLHGSLLGSIELGGLRYQAPELDFELQQASLGWRPLALLHGQLHITRLTAGGLHIHHIASGKTASGFKLPLSIELEHLTINDIQLDNNTGPPLQLQQLSAGLSLSHEQLTLQQFRLAAADFAVSLRGSLQQADGKLDLRSEWWIQRTDLPRISGQGHIGGDLQQLRFEQQLSTPASMHLSGSIKPPWRQAQWQLLLTAADLKPRQFNPAWPAQSLELRLRANGDLEQLALSAQLEGVMPELGKTRLKASLHGPLGSPWQVENLQLSLPGQPARLNASGQLVIEQHSLRYALQGDWQGLHWPLAGPPLLASPTGQFSLSGSDSRYQGSLQAALHGEQLPASHWQLGFAGDTAGLALSNIAASGEFGQLQGSGRLAWQAQPHWQLKLVGDGLNPAPWQAAWPGDLHAEFDASGGFAGPRPEFHLQLHRLSGRLRGYPLQAKAELSRQQSAYHLRQLELQVGDAHVHAAGSLGEAWQLDWSLQATDLAALWPDSHGQLSATGHLGGARRQPELRLQLAGQRLRYRQLQLDKLTAHVAADLSNRHDSRLELQAGPLRINDLAFTSVELDAQGKAAAHSLRLKLAGEGVRFSGELQGAYAAQHWQGSLRQAIVTPGKTEPWTLEQATPLSVSREAINLQRACWRQQSAQLCGSVDWQASADTRIQLEGSALPTRVFDGLLPEGLQWRDNIEGQLDARLNNNHLSRLQGSLHFGPGSISAPQQDEEPLALAYRAGDINIDADSTQTRLSLTATINDQDSIKAQLLLPGYPLDGKLAPQQALAGSLQASYRDLAVASLLVPELRKLTGVVNLDLKLSGSVAKPQLQGSASLSDGHFSLPPLGIEVEQVQLRANSAADNTLHWQGTAHSGRGQLQLEGQTLLQAGWPTRLSLKGSELDLVRRPGLLLVASPDLQAEIKARQVSLKGVLAVPRANIEFKGLPESAVEPSPDVVVIQDANNSTQKASHKWTIHGEIRVIPGEQVNFTGFGLSGKVAGELQLRQEPGKPLTASGKLELQQGHYSAFGIDLDVQRGQLIYADTPIDDPAVDLRATRSINEGDTTIIVGVHAQGRLKNTTVSLFSEPPMDDLDVLSYLTLGRPAEGGDTTTSSDADKLMAAAVALRNSGSYAAAMRVARSLGFEETRITRKGLVLGKSLSSRLYISYEIGLLEPTNTLLIRYRLSKHWTARSETSEHSGADLIYSIEK